MYCKNCGKGTNWSKICFYCIERLEELEKLDCLTNQQRQEFENLVEALA